MADIFKWLFGTSEPSSTKLPEPEPSRSRQQARVDPQPISGYVADLSLPGSRYFTELEKLTSSVTAKDYPSAAAAARASLPLLRSWLEDARGDGDRLDISIPALSQGGTMMAIIGDRDGLSEIRNLVQTFDYLKEYRSEAEDHFRDLDLFEQIREVIRAKPGVLQNRMKTELGIDDGRNASRLVSYLEKSGEIQRAKSGKTYELFMADFELPATAADTIYTEPATPGSHRQEMHAAGPRELDPKRVRIVPLPPSPAAWEHAVVLPTTQEALADPNGAWAEITIESISKVDRPDPAFRKHYSTRGGALSFDDLAKADASLGAPGAVMFSNVKGQSSPPEPLFRDPYHIAVHPEGEGFATRSKSNVLTAYDRDLKVDFETNLSRMPEVAANRDRLGMGESEAHRALRCIALTPERDPMLLR